MTYNDAYNKIIEAYFKDEIKILNANFCFCGTLSKDPFWKNCENHTGSQYPYTFKEYGRMERALFSSFPEMIWCSVGNIDDSRVEVNDIRKIKNYEEKL